MIPLLLQNAQAVQNPLDRDNAVRLIYLVEFMWGTGPTYARYARYDSDVVYDGNTFSACTILEIELGEQHGGSEDSPIKITIDRTKPPASLIQGKRIAPIQVRVWEIEATDADGTAVPVWSGRLSVAEENPRGLSSVVDLTVNGQKADFDSVLGLTVDSTCPYIPGDYLCKYNFSAGNVSAPIVSAAGSTISVALQAGLTDQPFLRWHRGYVSVDGYSIGIRGWSLGSFSLMRPPPDSWIGATAVFTPGCNGTLEACTYWGNTLNFGGIGRRMQNRNPVWETGEQ